MESRGTNKLRIMENRPNIELETNKIKYAW
jgi:hypothetical protein